MTTWTIEGGILPGELPDRMSRQDKQLGGLSPADYHLAGNETVGAAASRAWSYLESTYRSFRAELDKLPADEPAIGLTRDAWISPLLRELGYGRVSPTPGGHLTAGEADDARDYPISHLWNDVPMHLLGWNVSLDSRSKGVRGAARAPQSMLQEYLNRTPQHLWAILTNGRSLRLLRDSTNLVGQAFVDFDLEAIFDNDQYSDFVFLFALCHESRLERFPDEGDEPAPVTERWIEKWRNAGIELGTRALASLRGQVEQAIEALGTGYLQHPHNTGLRERISSGDPATRIDRADYQRALLRQVYRLLFWMVAEDRGALLAPGAPAIAAQRYDEYFSSRRLRKLARTRVGTRHHDLAAQTQLVFNGLGDTVGIPELGLPGLGGIFKQTAIDVLNDASIDNVSFLNAIRLLSTTRDDSSDLLRAVDFQHLGAEELGGIYEALLELHPRIDPAARSFTLASGAGNERKTTGSYYTPTSLIDLVLDTTLDPLLDRAEAKDTLVERDEALLALRVCDPACGSGHFLVAAARRIANRLARIRSDETEPSIEISRAATRDVVMTCIYGVDLNPMAAELAKVSLWLEALQPGSPLGFLDAHIKVGNSLIGTTPSLLAEGIPDGAYAPVTGDEKATATSWKKQNARERDQANQMTLLEGSLSAAFTNTVLVDQVKAVAQLPGQSLADVALQEQRYHQLQASPELRKLKLAADAWAAAFFQRKAASNPAAITTGTIQDIEGGRNVDPSVALAIDTLSSAHRFFHWHIEFPEIFTVPDRESPWIDPDAGWVGGFDAMIGNPPWERVKIQEKEFFAEREPDISEAPNAARRKQLIERLEVDNSELLQEFRTTMRISECSSKFLLRSGRFPQTGRGDVNTFQVFAELFSSSLAEGGCCGIITPSSLGTGATTAPFMKALLRTERLIAFIDFEDRGTYFPIHNPFRFAITAIQGRHGTTKNALLAARVPVVNELERRRVFLSQEALSSLNPNTGTLPVFRSQDDADICAAIYSRFPVLVRDGNEYDGNPWRVSFARLFDMANDSGSFRTWSDLSEEGADFDGWSWRSGTSTNPARWLPLYEAKMVHLFDSRFGTYEGATAAQLSVGRLPRTSGVSHDDPSYEVLAQYWVDESLVEQKLAPKSSAGYQMGWRDIATSMDVRTVVPSVIPRAASGNKFPLLIPADPANVPLLHATFSSLIFDYLARQKISGTGVTFFIVKQLAVPEPRTFDECPGWLCTSLRAFVLARVVELSYTCWSLRPYALAAGEGGAPFRWVDRRRHELRCEIDALFMHLYGLSRVEVLHVLESFPVLRRYEERDSGEFLTHRLVLDFYDRMTKAQTSGTPYETPIDPPPGHGPRHDGARP